jgi:hypothetical protein
MELGDIIKVGCLMLRIANNGQVKITIQLIDPPTRKPKIFSEILQIDSAS